MDRKERYFSKRNKDMERRKGRVTMTEKKIITDEKKLNRNKKSKEKILESKKNKQMRKKRLIIRNLSFKISEDELKEIFSKFGEILDVIIPIKQDGKKRGFAFIQYKDTKSQIKAMKEMNFKEIHGRPIAIDFAVDKTTYQTQQNNTKPSASSEKTVLKETASSNLEESEDEDIKSIKSESNSENTDSVASEDEDQQDSKVKAFFEEFDANKQENSESMDESSDDDDDGDDNDDQSDSENCDEEEIDDTKKPFKKVKSEDISEGKTVFIRNISYNSTEEDLQEVVQTYGDIHYCLFCMDNFTGQFKGSAFVKFKEKEDADKLIQDSSKEPGIILQHRPLNCSYALSREDLSKQNVPSKPKDKRNLNILNCGLIVSGSNEAEGVSKTDLAKRAQLDNVKKQKLRNVNFFVSDKRLMIHNLPKNITDKDLRVMFNKAAGKEATIKEARVMKDFKKTDARGVPVSRGFGFVSFTEHEHALKALMELNNNPNIFTSNTRPIVEFSVENKVALLSQERRRERLKMQNKKKNEERIKSQSQEPISPINTKRKKIKTQQPFSKDGKADNHHFEKMKQNKRKSPTSGVKQDKTSKRKQKKLLKRQSRKEAAVTQERNNLSALTDKYREKLLNKCVN